MAKKAKATHPVTAGMPRPSQNSSPNPRPDKVVKMMTEGAGCMSEFLQGLVQPADKALGLFGDGLEERGQHIDLAIGLWGGGRYLLTGFVPCSGIRSMPPRSATSFETSLSGSPRSPK